MRQLAAVFALAPFAVAVACSATSTPDGSSPAASSSQPPGASGASGHGSSGTPPPSAPHCAADLACGRARCPCPNGDELAATSICRGSDGQCAVIDACNEACGAKVDFAESWRGCKDDTACATSAPNVACACSVGPGWDAYSVCVDGVCSGKPSDVCPKACKNDGGWAGCATAADCADVVCPCADGKSAFPAGACSGGRCATADALCGTACGKHGGYKGGATPPPDAGPGGPKSPGDACTKGSECQPWSCACNDGKSYADNKMCISNVCPTQSEACGWVCSGHSGWSGH